MPFYFFLPPTVLDQSFPRSQGELNRVVDTLGEVQALVAGGQCLLATTEIICEFIEDFDWQNVGPDGLSILRDIYRVLSEIVARDGAASVLLNLPDTNPIILHPLPDSSFATNGLATIWQEEAGKLLVVHDQIRAGGSPFVEVPCERAFADGALGTYAPSPCPSQLPLISPNSLSTLADGEEWLVDWDDINAPVTFRLAHRNLACIGGKVRRPHGGSHHKVSFNNAVRPWILDPNDDPVPDAYLNQLPPLCGFPIDVVRFALLHGSLPKKRSRSRCVHCLVRQHSTFPPSCSLLSQAIRRPPSPQTSDPASHGSCCA